MNKKLIYKLTGTALCLALGLLLPILFHSLGAGTAFLPMHIPVLLCGLIFGGPFGAVCGLILPLLSSMLTQMPPLYPVAVAMTFELCTYGALTGLFYQRLKWNVYPALIGSMLGGRAVSGIANAILMGAAGKPYGFTTFLTASFVTALPGILIQLLLIPVLILALQKSNLVRR